MNTDILKLAAMVAFIAWVLNWDIERPKVDNTEDMLPAPYAEIEAKQMGILPERLDLHFIRGEGKEAQFVREFSKAALEESRRLDGKIPPSLIVAQAILESNYGKSRLATRANNYFGHKWRKGAGGWILVDDDAPNERFTKYRSRWYSLRAHTNLLMGSLYHGRLKGKPTLENWLDALCGSSDSVESKKFVKRGGRVYATACYNSCYACKLRAVVDKWKLHHLDRVI